MVDPPPALVPPVCAAPARHPFPDLRPDIVRWGMGGQGVESLVSLGEAHVRGLREWEEQGGKAGWVRERVRVWLFHHLFDPHAAELTRRVRARYPRLPSPDAVVSKAWMRAFQWWLKDDRQPVSNPMGWLMNATGYASLDRSSVMGGLFAPWPDQSDGGFDPSDPVAGRPDAEAEQAEWAGRVVRALGELTADERAMLELKFGDDLNYAEIGETFGISEEAARKRLTRLLSHLRKKLDPPLGESRS